MTRLFATTSAIATAIALVGGFTVDTAKAETVEVEMLNMKGGQMMVFEPAVVHIESGDSVRFVATDKGHNAQAVPGMVPDGGEDFQVPYNVDKEITFEADGVFGYKCLPHYSMGMVGLVVVGEPDVNIDAVREAAKGAPGKADDRFAQYLDQAKNGS